MDIQGKTVVVTGGARGIGKAIAGAYAREGARVVVGDLGSKVSTASGEWAYGLSAGSDLEATVAEIKANGGEATAVEMDVTDAGSCRDLVSAAKDSYGSLDVLVNNAGLVKMGPLVVFEDEDWDRIFDVNVKGVFLMSRAAVEPLSAAGGVVINISSIAGKKGYAGLGAYCASKFAVIGLTQAMAQELAAANIRVNAVCPGLLATAMWIDHLSVGVGMQSGKAAGREAFEDFVEQNTPLKREQMPSDIAEAAIYLTRADNVTGVALNVAGGTEMN